MEMRTVVAVVACLACCTILLLPRLKLGGLGSGQTTEVVSNCADQVARLEAEVAQLRKALKEMGNQLAKQQELIKSSGASIPEGAGAASQSKGAAVSHVVAPAGSTMDPVVPIDLNRMLGIDKFFGGVSFDINMCGLPMSQVWPKMSNDTLYDIIGRLNRDLQKEMGRILRKEVGLSASWTTELSPHTDHSLAEDAVVRDVRTREWRDAMSAVMSRYMVWSNHSMTLWCPGGPPTVTPEDLGSPRLCPGQNTRQIVRRLGHHANPYVAISTIAHDAVKWGICTKPPELVSSFGEWLRDERMFVPEWNTFNVDNPVQDAVVLLFDVLYESLGVFKKQYWMGTITMQNPFDMMSIADIIFTIKPDLIIETGTANGGSALMWASLMHLYGIAHGRVLTLDVADPTWDASTVHWGGIPRQDATKHELWKKHVTFIKGDSIGPATMSKVKEAAAGAKTVMVLLDSNHGEKYVDLEMRALCPLVTVGSYCIVEDTKLSRWSSDGPLPSARRYVEQSDGAWETDRERELVFTHHAMGYLLRKK